MWDPSIAPTTPGNALFRSLSKRLTMDDMSSGKEGAGSSSLIASATSMIMLRTVEIPILNKSANNEGGAPVATNLRKIASLISALILSLMLVFCLEILSLIKLSTSFNCFLVCRKRFLNTLPGSMAMKVPTHHIIIDYITSSRSESLQLVNLDSRLIGNAEFPLLYSSI